MDIQENVELMTEMNLLHNQTRQILLHERSKEAVMDLVKEALFSEGFSQKGHSEGL